MCLAGLDLWDDAWEHPAQCFTKCADNSTRGTVECQGYVLGVDTPDTMALCLSRRQCEDLCDTLDKHLVGQVAATNTDMQQSLLVGSCIS